VSTENDSFWEEVARISEIDMNAGLSQFVGNKKLYHNVLSMFQKKIVTECENMASFLAAKDIKSFTISIHAMKSLLATVAAAELSGEALQIEIAAKKDEIDSCVEKFPALKEKLLSLHERLAVLFPPAEAVPKKGQGDMAALRGKVREALSAAGDYDNNAGKKIVKDLLVYDFGERINGLLQSAMTAFQEFRCEDAARSLRDIGE